MHLLSVRPLMTPRRTRQKLFEIRACTSLPSTTATTTWKASLRQDNHTVRMKRTWTTRFRISSAMVSYQQNRESESPEKSTERQLRNRKYGLHLSSTTSILIFLTLPSPSGPAVGLLSTTRKALWKRTAVRGARYIFLRFLLKENTK
jgi:hypothetical protein